jgi:hypothetical protein
MTRQRYTLADFSHPLNLRCFHCDAELPGKTQVELYPGYVVAYCAQCGNCTVFAVEKDAA